MMPSFMLRSFATFVSHNRPPARERKYAAPGVAQCRLR
jgi:hypothetical protein